MPAHPDPHVGASRFPRPTRLDKALEFEPAEKIVPLPPPKALTAVLKLTRTPEDRCETARTYIATQTSLGCPLARIAKVLSVDAGDIMAWLVSSPANTALMAVAFEQGAERFDELARECIERINAQDADFSAKVLFSYANSYRCGAESKRALCQGLMRKVTVVGDSQIETRKRAWNERQAERMRQTRAAEKEAARQKRWQAHEQIINSMGHVAGPPADQIGANTDDLNPTELQHLMPAEFEELRDLMADDRLTESLALLGEIRARWRAEHGTPAAPTKPPALPNLASPTPRRSNKKAKIQ